MIPPQLVVQIESSLVSQSKQKSCLDQQEYSGLKVCIWTRIPNHYQRAFMGALGGLCNLRTVYFEKVPDERLALGWSDTPQLSDTEIRCDNLMNGLRAIPDWKERIHIVPGYGGTFQRSLARHLSSNRVPWADWSESSTPGWKWYARLPVKLWWTKLLSNASLGSFAIGHQAEDDFVRRGIPRSRISYLPYVVPKSDVDPKPDVPMLTFKSGRRTFLFLGSLSKRKGVDLLLQAARPVLRAHPEWTLIFVGNDPDSKYRKIAEKLEISSQIFFRGPVSPQCIGSVIAASDVLVLPSRYDGWGVVINEAVTGGLAVIASDKCGAARHLVVPGYNGFRIGAGSLSDLEISLKRYATSDSLAEEHGSGSRCIATDVEPELNARRMLSSLSVWLREKS